MPNCATNNNNNNNNTNIFKANIVSIRAEYEALYIKLHDHTRVGKNYIMLQ